MSLSFELLYRLFHLSYFYALTSGFWPEENAQITTAIDTLLSGYERHVRPGANNSPLPVLVDIYIRSMGPLSDQRMTYSIDCYFRQRWVDSRLSFKVPHVDSLSLNNKFLELIWKPDTYFLHSRKSYVHVVYSPNKFVRLTQNGTILYSSRLTVRSWCNMRLENFPMDVQICPLEITSYGFSVRDIVYLWAYGEGNSVVLAPDMVLPQFDIDSITSGHRTIKIMNETFSVLYVNFKLHRHIGHFLIHVYVPCSLLVVLSWVSFWLNRESTADRISLGFITILNLTFVMIEERSNLPKVDYYTALDWFMLACFLFVFASLLEFASVHFFTKSGFSDVIHIQRFFNIKRSNDQCHKCDDRTIGTISNNSTKSGSRKFDNYRQRNQSNHGSALDCVRDFLTCLKGIRLGDEDYEHLNTGNSVSRIDKCARIVFPLCFATFTVFYFWLYTSRSHETSSQHTSILYSSS